MGGTGLGLAIGGRWIAALFLDPTKADATTVFDFAAPLLVIAALFQLFDGTQAIAAGALRGLKDSRGPMVIGLIAYWPIGMASGAILGFWLDLRLVGLWSGLALGLAVAAVALTVRFHLKSRRLPEPAKG
jgi:MATE family multidrug resistance protein